MRRLIVHGRPQGKNVDHELIRDSIRFFEKTLFSVHAEAFSEVALRVNFIPNLQEQYNSTGFSGWTDQPVNPRTFIIELDGKLDYKTTLITLAHEFTHVKQYAMGEKQDSLDRTTSRWFGMHYVVDDIHYYDHPWEIEAHGREYGMYDRYVNQARASLEPAKIVNGKVLSIISSAVA